ncbi:MAG TPA: hypothetical protein VGK50_02495 [Coriobacteriia bacterium]|jgi:hypothetical protein
MRRALVVACAVALLLTAPAAALAVAPSPAATAPATPAPLQNAKPVTPQLVDVQLWPEDVKGSMTIIVVALVPTSTPLPATVALPLPKGATVTWAGEIFENNSQDVQRSARMSPDGASLSIATAKSRFVQYEAQYKPYVDRGNRRYAQLDWVQSKPAGVVRFAFRMPPFSNDVKSSPPFARTSAANSAGEKIYSLADRKLKVGEAVKLSVDYIPQAPALPTAPQGPDILLLSLLAVLGIVLAALAFVVVRSRRAA